MKGRRSSRSTGLGSCLVFVTLLSPSASSGQSSVQIVTSDGVTIHGDLYDGGLDAAAPLVVLFHQGGSSGRGEYGPIVPWLNSLGYRAIAFDQRSGGEVHEVANRTLDGLAAGVPSHYCDAYPDLQAALEYVVSQGLSPRPIIWGSSYSGALVFRLAAEYPQRVAGVLAFSPASGPPMADCLARAWVGDISVPLAVFRPSSEMDRESAQGQRDLVIEAGLDFFEIPEGVHGSSMLVDERTGQDMTAARDSVEAWLARHADPPRGESTPAGVGPRLRQRPPADPSSDAAAPSADPSSDTALAPASFTYSSNQPMKRPHMSSLFSMARGVWDS